MAPLTATANYVPSRQRSTDIDTREHTAQKREEQKRRYDEKDLTHTLGAIGGVSFSTCFFPIQWHDQVLYIRGRVKGGNIRCEAKERRHEERHYMYPTLPLIFAHSPLQLIITKNVFMAAPKPRHCTLPCFDYCCHSRPGRASSINLRLG